MTQEAKQQGLDHIYSRIKELREEIYKEYMAGNLDFGELGAIEDNLSKASKSCVDIAEHRKLFNK